MKGLTGANGELPPRKAVPGQRTFRSSSLDHDDFFASQHKRPFRAMCFQIIRSFSCGCARHHKLECCVSKALRLSSSTTGVAPLSPGEGCDWTISGPRRFRFSTPCQTCAYAQCIWLTGNFSISSKGSAWTGLMKNGAAAERVVGFRWLRETRAKLKRTLQERDREEKDGEDFEWRTEHWRRMLQRKRIRREVRNRWREKRRGREERGL